jgi:hypothetical protein
VNDRAYTLHRWWWHWWRDMRFDSYVKKDKLSSYVCFVLTDQNTISEFLTNTVSITLHQNKHFTQKQHTSTWHSSLQFIISTEHSSLQFIIFTEHSSLQYIHLYNIRLSKQTTSIYNLSIYTKSLSLHYLHLNKAISTKLSWQSYLNKAILTKLSQQRYI